MTTTSEKTTVKVYPGFKLNPCDRKCESSPKIGRSWWKQYGYNSACLCLEDKIKLEFCLQGWEFCLQGVKPNDSVSNVEIYNKSGLNLMAESFVKPNDSKIDYSFVLAHHSDDDSDYGDICNACGELQDVDDETCMVGNFTVCLKCYEEDYDGYKKEIEDGCPEGHKTIWDNYYYYYYKR